MISNLSSTAASTNVQQYQAVRHVPSPSQGATSTEDTVQLSAETQQHLANNTKGSTPPAQPSFDEIIKEAADGNIAALAKLALVG
jgi:hypothetical protein